MEASKRVDFSKLLGFDIVTDDLFSGVDLQSEMVSARLGAKVGPEPGTLFSSESDDLGGRVDFQNEGFAAKLGAKVGTEICLALDLRSGAANDPARGDSESA